MHCHYTTHYACCFILCYEIGNRHLPLFYEGDDLLVPYEVPLYNLLQATGYELKVEERKLRQCFKNNRIAACAGSRHR